MMRLNALLTSHWQYNLLFVYSVSLVAVGANACLDIYWSASTHSSTWSSYQKREEEKKNKNKKKEDKQTLAHVQSYLILDQLLYHQPRKCVFLPMYSVECFDNLQWSSTTNHIHTHAHLPMPSTGCSFLLTLQTAGNALRLMLSTHSRSPSCGLGMHHRGLHEMLAGMSSPPPESPAVNCIPYDCLAMYQFRVFVLRILRMFESVLGCRFHMYIKSLVIASSERISLLITQQQFSRQSLVSLSL